MTPRKPIISTAQNRVMMRGIRMTKITHLTFFGVKASHEKAEKDMNDFAQSLDAAAQKKTYDSMVKKYGKEKNR